VNTSIGEVSSSGRLACSAERAWQKVCFYEHISRRLPWLLRTALPTPHRTTGSHERVGDVSRCMYSDGGYLAKRIARIVPGERIDFEIIEQTIRHSRRVVLRGGSIEIESHADGTSSVRMTTRYELRSRTFLSARFFVNLVVAAMHRVVIRDMQDRLSRVRGATRTS